MSWITINCRWLDADSERLESLGIETNDNYIMKEVDINLNKIVGIEEYEGFCVVRFSFNGGDELITDIPFEQKKQLQL